MLLYYVHQVLVYQEIYYQTKVQLEQGKVQLQQARILMPSHPSHPFEIQKQYLNESKLNGVYSRNNLPKLKDGALNQQELTGQLYM